METEPESIELAHIEFVLPKRFSFLSQELKLCELRTKIWILQNRVALANFDRAIEKQAASYWHPRNFLTKKFRNIELLSERFTLGIWVRFNFGPKLLAPYKLKLCKISRHSEQFFLSITFLRSRTGPIQPVLWKVLTNRIIFKVSKSAIENLAIENTGRLMNAGWSKKNDTSGINRAYRHLAFELQTRTLWKCSFFSVDTFKRHFKFGGLLT